MRIPSGTTNRYIYFVAVDTTDLKTRETGLSSFTVYYEIANGTATAMTTPTVTEADATNMPGVYTLLIDESGMTTLTSGHDTAELCLHITQASMAPVTRVIEIYRAKITEGNTLDVTATGAAGVDWGNVENPGTTVGLSATTVGTVTTLTNLPAITANWLTATGIAADAITAAKVAADVSAEIADAVLDEDMTAHQTQGTLGQAIGDPGADTDTIWGLANTNLDAAVSSRMATYTQPAGFLAATFPSGTIANTTNITAGTITTTTNLTNLPAITTDWITAAGLAADAVAEIKNAILPQKNIALDNLEFLMVDSTDHVTPKTGLTVSGTRSIDGGAFGAVTGTIAEVANGIYQLDASAADMNGTIITFRFTGTAADATYVTIKTGG